MGFIYLIFGICAVAVSIGKTLAVNFGISKYLSKKPYEGDYNFKKVVLYTCLLYTSPSPRDLSTSRMPSSA